MSPLISEFKQAHSALRQSISRASTGATTFAAMLRQVAGAPNAGQFAVFILDTGTAAEAAALLQSVGRAGEKIIAEWSGRATNLLNCRRGDSRVSGPDTVES